jgi:hypothetical protein
MTHLVDEMVYPDQTPWHSQGNALPPGQPIDTWARQAGRT